MPNAVALRACHAPPSATVRVARDSVQPPSCMRALSADSAAKRRSSARMRALLRRFAALSADSARMQLGGCTLSRATRTVADGGAWHARSATALGIPWHLAALRGAGVQRYDSTGLVGGTASAEQTPTV
ncbi:hypothetical protein CF641_38105, partial [Burkholderia pseudomallei]